jgi:hypothetical protein
MTRRRQNTLDKYMIIFLSYNLSVLEGGPTFFINDTILYILITGASIIQVMRIRKDDIIAKYLHSAHTINGDQKILKTHRQSNQTYGIGIIASGFTII